MIEILMQYVSVCINNLLSPGHCLHSSWTHLRRRVLFEVLRHSKAISLEEHSKIVEEALIVRGEEGESFAFHACSTCSSGSVDELTDVFGSVIVDYRADTFHIESSSCQISRY